MAFARDVYSATGGQTDFTITFPYLEQDDVVVSQNGTTLVLTTDYTFFNSTTIRLVTGATAADAIVIQRATDQATRNTTWVAGAMTSDDLNAADNQLFYMAQEAIDIANTALGLDSADEWDALTKLIHNVVDPVADQDAATKNYVDQAALGVLSTPLSIANGGTSGATALAAQQALGVEVDVDVQSHVMTTQGDMVRAGASGAPERVALGAAGTILESDGTDAAWVAKESVTTPFPYPQGWINGLEMGPNSIDPTNDIDVATGVARDGADSDNIVLASTLIKQLDASWAVGTNAGMLDGTESSAGTPDVSTWYHIWLIKRSDTGVVDILASESATAPTMPTNYDLKRRIGAVWNDASGDIAPFHQIDNRFFWDDVGAIAPYSTNYTNPGVTERTETIHVPTGVECLASVKLQQRDPTPTGGIHLQTYSTSAGTISTPSYTTSDVTTDIDNEIEAISKILRTDTNGQINWIINVSPTDISIYFVTRDWEDPRGRW